MKIQAHKNPFSQRILFKSLQCCQIKATRQAFLSEFWQNETFKPFLFRQSNQCRAGSLFCAIINNMKLGNLPRQYMFCVVYNDVLIIPCHRCTSCPVYNTKTCVKYHTLPRVWGKRYIICSRVKQTYLDNLPRVNVMYFGTM